MFHFSYILLKPPAPDIFYFVILLSKKSKDIHKSEFKGKQQKPTCAQNMGNIISNGL